MKNLFIIPTNKLSKIGFDSVKNLHFVNDFIDDYQHIYITNDEEIKEGWSGYAFKEDVEGKVFKHFYTQNEWYKDAKKIILTDNQDLIADGVQSIDDEFLEWFVKNQSCEFVKVEVDLSKHNGEFQTKYGYKIIISKKEQSTKDRILSETPDEVKQRIRDRADLLVNKEETLEEVAEKYPYCYASYGSQRKAFTDGAKWQQEQDKDKLELAEHLYTVVYKEQNKNKYSEEEVKELLKMYRNSIVEVNPVDIIYLDKWFEKFKKKSV